MKSVYLEYKHYFSKFIKKNITVSYIIFNINLITYANKKPMISKMFQIFRFGMHITMKMLVVKNT